MNKSTQNIDNNFEAQSKNMKLWLKIAVLSN